MALWFLVEGIDVSVTVHYIGHGDATLAHWLWLAIDPVSKALPSLHLGGRTSADAYAVVHDVKERLDPSPTCVSPYPAHLVLSSDRSSGAAARREVALLLSGRPGWVAHSYL